MWWGWGGRGGAVVIRHEALNFAERRIAANPKGSTSTMHLMQIIQISEIIQLIQLMKIIKENTINKMKKIEML